MSSSHPARAKFKLKLNGRQASGAEPGLATELAGTPRPSLGEALTPGPCKAGITSTQAHAVISREGTIEKSQKPEGPSHKAPAATSGFSLTKSNHWCCKQGEVWLTKEEFHRIDQCYSGALVGHRAQIELCSCGSNNASCTLAAPPPQQSTLPAPAPQRSTLVAPPPQQSSLVAPPPQQSKRSQNTESINCTTSSGLASTPGEQDVDSRIPANSPPVRLPITVDSGCVGDDQSEHIFEDLQPVHGHASRAIWVCPDGHIFLEAFNPLAQQISEFLIAIAEPVSRPDSVHEYQITVLSLQAFFAVGHDSEGVIRVLKRLSKNLLDARLINAIKLHGESGHRVRLVLRSGHHILEAASSGPLARLCAVSSLRDGAFVGQVRPVGTSHSELEVDSLWVERVKAAAHDMQIPLLQEFAFAQDQNPELQIARRPSTKVRPYQSKALSQMFSVGRARSGIIVLPCGAGKTLVGIIACCTLRRRTLVLTTTAVAVDQWRRQFLQYTDIAAEDIIVLTADHKQKIDNAETRGCVLISTYSMMGFSGQRSSETEFVMDQITKLEWGLLIVDEVQVMPARTFRTVATTVKSHCSLGLTATLVREDNLIYDLHWLIGPKLYEASWMQLQDEGYLARVRCVEVCCKMTRAFFAEYIDAIEQKDPTKERSLRTCNPNKLKICEHLMRFHEDRGDKIIVFSDDVFILEEFARQTKRYFICGKVGMHERMQILTEFQENNNCNTVFISKVGDNAIDIPAANVIIQISSHFGSRRQEAQRLGRILRPKPRNFESNDPFNAFFYSLVSNDTKEMFYANKRQQFLVEQGYAYQVLHDHKLDERSDLIYSSEAAQLQLLKKVLEFLRRGNRAVEDDDVALFGPSGEDGFDSAKLDGTGVASQSSVQTSEVSLELLSGGLNGRYSTSMVSLNPPVKRAASEVPTYGQIKRYKSENA